MYADKTIRCRDCGMDFVFSGGEQQFYAEKGLMNEPQRCQSCRSIAKHRNGPIGEVPLQFRKSTTRFHSVVREEAVAPFA